MACLVKLQLLNRVAYMSHCSPSKTDYSEIIDTIRYIFLLHLPLAKSC